ncbi:HAMP domain-containing protein [bacterium]|nr:HAMP domain-containing protein [bacterium]
MKRKLIALVVLVGGLALMLAFGSFLIYDRIHYKKQLVRDLEILAEMIGSNCSASLLFNIPSDAEEIISALEVHPNILSCRIFTIHGDTFAQYLRSDMEQEQMNNPLPLFQARSSDSLSIKSDSTWKLPVTLRNARFEENRLMVFHPIVLDREIIGAVALESDLTVVQDRFRKSLNAIILVMITTIVAMVLLTAKLQVLITKPIMYLSMLAKRVSNERDYSIRAKKNTKDEIGSLIDSFNDMLSQIEVRDNTIQETSKVLENQAKKLKKELKKRRQVERTIKHNLKEKDILMQEIHHRVKNNLQIVSSLLKLQLRSVSDPGTVTMFEDCHNRVYTMSLIHEQLYRSNDFSNINLSEYIQSLTKHLFHIYKDPGRQINLDINVEKVSLDLNTAIPSGLMINELVSNSLKYAFTDRMQGRIGISLTRADGGYEERTARSSLQTYVLCVEDDGKGLPAGLDISKADTLGLKLVYALTRQLHGEVRIENHHGTKTIITFNIQE